MKVNKRILIYVLLIFLLITDQIVKQLITSYILPGSSLPVIGEFIHLTPVKNQGLLMGLFSFPSYLTIFLTVFVITLFLVVLLLNLREKGNLGMAFIIGGTVGNLWDRVFRGGVIDFIDVKFWPIFNLADIFITAGVVLLCLSLLFPEKRCTE